MPRDGQESVYTTLPPTPSEAAATISRAESMAAFLKVPLLPNTCQMRVDHVTALLALLLEDPLRYAAISLICKRYSPEDSSYIWSQ